MSRILLLTGMPGVGKTTVLLRTVEALKAKGYKVGGMLSREVRSAGSRVGFEILSLSDNEHGWLANVNQGQGPQVGKYRVNLDDLNRVGVGAIMKAVESCDVVAIDEIGPMELYSDSFREAVTKAFQSMKPVVATVHWRQRDRLMSGYDKIGDAHLFEVTLENRERLHELVVKEVTDFILQKTLDK